MMRYTVHHRMPVLMSFQQADKEGWNLNRGNRSRCMCLFEAGVKLSVASSSVSERSPTVLLSPRFLMHT
jgi:hypothetical protein